jgi:hypothetical protein
VENQKKSLPSKKVKDKRNDHANEDTGGQRKIESVATPLDDKVARQAPEPRHLAAKEKEYSDHNEQNANIYQRLAKFAHGSTMPIYAV